MSKILNAGPQTSMETMKPSTKSETSDQSDNIQKENTDPVKSKVPSISFAQGQQSSLLTSTSIYHLCTCYIVYHKP